jgi:bifunctional DNase/RNase
MGAVETLVEQVTLDPVLGAPVVILHEKEGGRTIPIWVGQLEAAAIVSELRAVPMARPSSHDLMKELIARLRGAVSHVTVTDVRNGTFFAEVALETPEGVVSVDARPSDAIALALRARASIYVEQHVMDRAWCLREALDPGLCEESVAPRVLLEVIREDRDGLLEGLAEEEFGKWKM